MTVGIQSATAPSRPRRRRRGFLGLDVFVVLFLFGLIILFFAALLPGILRARELAKRTVCAANLNGLGKGFYDYGTENADDWPIAAHLVAGEEWGVGKVQYAPRMIGTKRGKEGNWLAGESTVEDTKLSTTRNLWMLVRAGAATPASFICPSTRDQRNDQDNPQDFWDFRGYTEVSYGYQVPYGRRGKPTSERDPNMVLSADKGPYGAALEAGEKDPGVPTPKATDAPQAWRDWNSPNHRRQGQNALYADSHVELAARPTTGVKDDNIYTRWADKTGGRGKDDSPRVAGTPPTSNEAPGADTDSLIYP